MGIEYDPYSRGFFNTFETGLSSILSTVPSVFLFGIYMTFGLILNVYDSVDLDAPFCI